MDSPSNNTRRRRKSLRTFPALETAGFVLEENTQNTETDAEDIAEISTSPFVIKAVFDDTQDDRNTSQASNDKNPPQSWLQFKPATQSPGGKAEIFPSLQLNHLDSLELRGRVIPKTPYHKKRAAKSPRKHTKKIEKIASLFLKVQQMNLGRLLAKAGRSKPVRCLVITLLLVVLVLCTKRTPFLSNTAAASSGSPEYPQELKTAAGSIKKIQQSVRKETAKRDAYQAYMDEQLRKLSEKIEMIQKKHEYTADEARRMTETVQMLHEISSYYFKFPEDTTQTPGLSEFFVAALQKLEEGKRPAKEQMIELERQIETLQKTVKETAQDRPGIPASKPELIDAIQTFVRKEMAKNTETPLNYALAANGATIVPRMTTERYSSTGKTLSILGIGIRGNPPETALNEDMAVCHCWAFNGPVGKLTIKLAASIYPQRFELRHIPWSISPYRSRSAVKDFVLYGYATKKDLEEAAKFFLCSDQYDIHGTAAQHFAVQAQEQKIEYVSIEINSNHGEDFTSVYSIGVYGAPAEESPAKEL